MLGLSTTFLGGKNMGSLFFSVNQSLIEDRLKRAGDKS